MAFSTNGTTVSFGGTNIARVTDVEWSVGGETIEISDLASARRIYETGHDDIDVTITVVGHSTAAAAINRGSTGTLSIAWNDSVTDTVTGNFVCTSKRVTGSRDNEITTQITLKPQTTS